MPSTLTDAEMSVLQRVSVTEKLLLAQAVYETGLSADDEDASWDAVCKLLKGHPLLGRGKPRGTRRGFKPHTAKKIYEVMVGSMGLKPSPQAPNSPQLLQVARKYYLARVHELRQAMREEQDRFQATYHQLSLLQSGALDHALTSPALRSLASAEHAARQTQIRERRQIAAQERETARRRAVNRLEKRQKELERREREEGRAGNFVLPDGFYGVPRPELPASTRPGDNAATADPETGEGEKLGSGLTGAGFFGSESGDGSAAAAPMEIDLNPDALPPLPDQ